MLGTAAPSYCGADLPGNQAGDSPSDPKPLQPYSTFKQTVRVLATLGLSEGPCLDDEPRDTPARIHMQAGCKGSRRERTRVSLFAVCIVLSERFKTYSCMNAHV